MSQMRHLQILLAAGAVIFPPQIASAGDIKVIANSTVTTSAITASELKNVFLVTTTSLSDGGHVEPVLEKRGATHSAFLKQYIGKTDAALETYYRSLVFTGRASMPKSFASDVEVSEYVAKTKGAIGYVSAGASVAGVKTVDIR